MMPLLARRPAFEVRRIVGAAGAGVINSAFCSFMIASFSR
jgi:hypothetical protein